MSTPRKLYHFLFVVTVLLSAGCEDEAMPGSVPPEPGPGMMEPETDPNASYLSLDLETTFQTIDHFGASDGWSAEWVGRWPESSKEPIAELLFSKEFDSQGNPKGIGLSMWRFNIGDGSADQRNSGFIPNSWDRETECFLSIDGTYDWSKQAGAQWFLRRAKEYGVEKVTGWTTSPPYFMTKNGYTFRTDGIQGWNLDPGRADDYATELATIMKHFEDAGTPIDHLSPFNEPQYPWRASVGAASQSGSYATNTELSAFTRRVSEKLTELGSVATLLIPEAANVRNIYEGNDAVSNQAFTFFNPASPLYVGDLPNLLPTVAAHSYFSNRTMEVSVNRRKALRNRLITQGMLGYWQTEYSILGGDYLQGRQASNLSPIDYSIWLAQIIHNDLASANASGWSFWTALSRSNFADHAQRFNFIRWVPNANGPEQSDGGYVVVKNLYAFGNFSRFVRPGMVRVALTDTKFPNEVSAVENFATTAYVSPDGRELVMVFINAQATNHPVYLQGYGDGYSFTGNELVTYTTSGNRNLTRSTVKADEEITIPARSIVTLTAAFQ